MSLIQVFATVATGFLDLMYPVSAEGQPESWAQD